MNKVEETIIIGLYAVEKFWKNGKLTHSSQTQSYLQKLALGRYSFSKLKLALNMNYFLSTKVKLNFTCPILSNLV